MHIISWIVFGLIAGFIASKIVNKSGSGVLMDIVIGIVGAFVGGYIGQLLHLGMDGSFLWDLVLSVAGAVIVLVVYRAVTSRA